MEQGVGLAGAETRECGESDEVVKLLVGAWWKTRTVLCSACGIVRQGLQGCDGSELESPEHCTLQHF